MTAKARSRPFRASTGFALAVFAALPLGVACLLSANNRLAETGTAVGTLGKLAFGPGPEISRGALTLTDRSADAERLASDALVSDPMNARALDVMAGGALLRNDPTRADAVFRVAAMLGWRDVATQRYWLFASLNAGDVEHAAQRLEALLRLGQATSAERTAASALEATPAGRRAIVSQLRTSPAEIEVYLAMAPSLSGSALANRVAVLRLAAQNDVPVQPDVVARATVALANNGHVPEARAIWQALDPQQSAGAIVTDGQFEITRPDAKNQSPFEWRLPPSASISSAIAPAPSPMRGNGLNLRHLDSLPATAAEQILSLPPGGYSLSWTIVGDPDAIVPAVRCGQSGRGSVPMLADAAGSNGRYFYRFVIPAQADCAVQRLDVDMAGAHGPPSPSVWVDDIAIAKTH